MQITSIDLYNMLKGKLGDKEAGSLVNYMETKTEELFLNKMNILVTKAELAEVKSDLIKWMFIFWVGQIGVMIAILNIYFH